MKRCKHADKYKALYPPRCGCTACTDKWARVNAPLPPGQLDIIEAALMTVRLELIRATKLHGPMRSHHEAYGVIMEEVEEFFDEVRANDRKRARKELTQAAAMCVRAMIDV